MPRRISSPPRCLRQCPLHIGHIMEYIQADIWVRFQRMQDTSCTSSAPTTRTARRSCSRRRAKASPRSSSIARIAAGRPSICRGFHLSFDHWHSTDSPEEHAAVAGRVRAAQDIRPRLPEGSRAVLRPGEGNVPGGPLHQGRNARTATRKISMAMRCEVCSTVYAPTDLINPYSALTGARRC